jgi:hypothetical protein
LSEASIAATSFRPLDVSLEPDGPAVAEIAAPRDVAGPLQAVEHSGHGLRLLGEIFGDEVRLGPVERVDRESA